MCEAKIIDRGRGLEIARTRITVYTILECLREGWRPVSWTAGRREAVSPIPGAQTSGETVISRPVRETGDSLAGWPLWWRSPTGLIKRPFWETVGVMDSGSRG